MGFFLHRVHAPYGLRPARGGGQPGLGQGRGGRTEDQVGSLQRLQRQSWLEYQDDPRPAESPRSGNEEVPSSIPKYHDEDENDSDKKSCAANHTPGTLQLKCGPQWDRRSLPELSLGVADFSSAQRVSPLNLAGPSIHVSADIKL